MGLGLSVGNGLGGMVVDGVVVWWLETGLDFLLILETGLGLPVGNGLGGVVVGNGLGFCRSQPGLADLGLVVCRSQPGFSDLGLGLLFVAWWSGGCYWVLVVAAWWSGGCYRSGDNKEEKGNEEREKKKS